MVANTEVNKEIAKKLLDIAFNEKNAQAASQYHIPPHVKVEV